MKPFSTTPAATALVAFVLAVAGSPIGNSSTTPELLVTRDGVSGMQYCGNFAPADGPMAEELINKLNQGSLKDLVYKTAPGGCNRVQCWDTSGIYVCNDNNYELSLTGAEISRVATIPMNACCMISDKAKMINRAQMAGQQFTQWGWNVVIAYANCNHDGTQKPSTIGGYGINGPSCASDSSMTTNA